MTGKVSVGCKLPHGLILEMGDERVTVKGANDSTLIGGHGITEGVDKDFFDAWLDKNKGLDFVKKGLIFASEKATSVNAEAKEKQDETTGFEGLDPDALPKDLAKAD